VQCYEETLKNKNLKKEIRKIVEKYKVEAEEKVKQHCSKSNDSQK
jgi:hypothetical protein